MLYVNGMSDDARYGSLVPTRRKTTRDEVLPCVHVLSPFLTDHTLCGLKGKVQEEIFAAFTERSCPECIQIVDLCKMVNDELAEWNWP